MRFQQNKLKTVQCTNRSHNNWMYYTRSPGHSRPTPIHTSTIYLNQFWYIPFWTWVIRIWSFKRTRNCLFHFIWSIL